MPTPRWLARAACTRRRKLALFAAASGIGLWLLAGLANAIARRATAAVLENKLDVEVGLSGVDLAWLGGAVELAGLEIANPSGFSERRFVRVQAIELDAHPLSLMRNPVRASALSVRGAELRLERSGLKTNVGRVLSALEGSRKQSGADEGRKFLIDQVEIPDAVLLIDWSGSGTPKRIGLPPLRLERVGNAQGGSTAAELAGAVLATLLEASIEAAGDLFPVDLRGELSALLEDVAGWTKGWDKLARGLTKGAKGALEKAGDALESVGKGIGDLFDRR